MLHLMILTAFAGLLRANVGQGPDVRYQNVTYRLPAGWKADPGREYMPYLTRGSSKAATMTISRPQPSPSFLQDAAGLFADMLRTPLTIETDGPRSITVDRDRTCIILSSAQCTASTLFAPDRENSPPSVKVAALIDLGDKSQQVIVDVYDPKSADAARAGAEAILRSMRFDNRAPARTPYGWQQAESPPAILADLDIEVSGGGQYVSAVTNSHPWYRVKRSLSARGIRLFAGRPPLFERSVLNALTGRAERLPSFAQDGPHPAAAKFDDRNFLDGDVRVAPGVKTRPRFTDDFRWIAPSTKSQRQPSAAVDGLRVVLDRAGGRYAICLPGIAGGATRCETDYARVDDNVTYLRHKVVHPLVPVPLSVFAGLHPDLKFTGGALGGSLVRPLPEAGRLLPIEGQVTIPAAIPVTAFAKGIPAGPVTITYKWRLYEP